MGWVDGSTRDGVDDMGGETRHVKVPAELKSDVSAHGFWKRRTTAMFGIRIINLNVVSYLRMTPKKALEKA